MFNFNQMFPISQGKQLAPVCGYCDGRGVIPQDGKVVSCPKCNGTGKEKQ